MPEIISTGLRLTHRKPPRPACTFCDEPIAADDPRDPLQGCMHLRCWYDVCEQEQLCPRCGTGIGPNWSMCRSCALEVA